MDAEFNEIKNPPPLKPSWGPRIVALLALVGFLAFLSVRLWPNEESAIREWLGELSEVLSRPKKLPMLALVGKANRLKGFLAKDCRILVGSPVPTVNGREDIASAFAASLRVSGALQVRFSGTRITLDTDRRTAQVTLTATATRGASSFTPLKERLVLLNLVKEEGEWKLASAEPWDPEASAP
ncbi:MAG: nuclear transport factor 2 family protein [Planctomycetota bacterium]|jgi:hypothetical protein